MGINDLSILPGAGGTSLGDRFTNSLAALTAGGKASATGVAAGKTAAAPGDDQDAVVRAAKDFESVLVQKLLEEMKNTIPDSGLNEDGASKQMQDMFWLYMGQTVGQQGGLGLWKQMVRQLQTPTAKQAGVNVETLR